MSSNKSGFSLTEVLIAVALLAVVMGSAVTATRAGEQAFRQSVTNGVVDAKACRALNRIARELNGAGLNTLFPQRRVPESAESVSIQRIAGWDGNQATWTNDFEIRLEYELGEVDNGLDDDADGFVDECRVVLVEDSGTADERRVVIVNQVSEFLEGEIPNGDDDNNNLLEDERGLCFELVNDWLVIRLTVMGRAPEGGTIFRTLQTTVGLRN